MNNTSHMEPLVSFPYNAFLMLRLEYVQIFQDELQAKLLRIIEMHVETQRQVIYREEINKQKGDHKPIEVPKDIFVPISYKLFMNDLYDLITSETTIKKALNALIEYKIIFKKEAPKRRYAPPEYSINAEALQLLLNSLKHPEHQKLRVSILDALKNSGYQELIPSWYQKLIPSILAELENPGYQKLMPSNFDTNIRKEEFIHTYKKERKKEPSASQEDSSSHSFIPSSLPLSSLGADQTQYHIVTRTTHNPVVPTRTAVPEENTLNTREVKNNNIESMTTRNASPPGVSLSNEEQKIYDWWCETEYVAVPPAIKQKLQDDCKILAKNVKSLEDFNSLVTYTSNQPKLKGKEIFLGNLVSCLNGWKQLHIVRVETKKKVLASQRHLVPISQQQIGRH